MKRERLSVLQRAILSRVAKGDRLFMSTSGFFRFVDGGSLDRRSVYPLFDRDLLRLEPDFEKDSRPVSITDKGRTAVA